MVPGSISEGTCSMTSSPEQSNGLATDISDRYSGKSNSVSIPEGKATETNGDHGSDSTCLRLPSNDTMYDLIGVGFGPASLAIAVALQDLKESHAVSGTQKADPQVHFLEQQDAFHWHAGMLLPGAKMQISFIKDLATLRNPRSHFTFLNYLQKHNRLVQFSNLGTFLPSRLEFENYMKWAASHFEDSLSYSQNVQRIRPRKRKGGAKFNSFEVESKDSKTGAITTHLCKNVVIAVGGKPWVPSIFPGTHNRVVHSSQYSMKIGDVLPAKGNAYTIAGVGGGQSAAEVFDNLQTRYPNASTRLIFRDTALRPSDDSPFVNEVFNPETVNEVYEQEEEIRNEDLKKNKSTNYSVVRLELLEKIYEDQYMQSVREPDKTKWQHQILSSREIVEVVDHPQNKRLNLVLKCNHSAGRKCKEVLTVMSDHHRLCQ